MADTIDLRESPDQIASMKQHIFAALNACTDEEPVDFDIEATFYDDYNRKNIKKNTLVKI